VCDSPDASAVAAVASINSMLGRPGQQQQYPQVRSLTLWFLFSSVADPECLSWIPDPTFFHPGSKFFSIPDPGSTLKNLRILTQKNCFLSSRKYDPGCSSQHCFSEINEITEWTKKELLQNLSLQLRTQRRCIFPFFVSDLWIIKKQRSFFCQDLATNPYLQHMLENYSNLMYNSLASQQRRPEAQLPLQNGGASRPSGARMSGGGGGGTGGQDKAGPPSRGGPSWCWEGIFCVIVTFQN
jgi:hypothetical protein